MPGRLSLFPNEISKYEFSSNDGNVQSRRSLSIVFESHASVGLSDEGGGGGGGGGGMKSIARVGQVSPLEEIDEEEKSQEWQSSSEEDCRSSSPSTSVKSSSEIGGDSGVSSEHESPPLDSRKAMHQKTSSIDSDIDCSSNSSESFQDLSEVLPPPPPKQEKGDRQSPVLQVYKHKEHKRNKRSSKGHLIPTSRLPDFLLREIKAKALEMTNKRQMMKSDSGRDRCPLSRSSSFQRSTRVSRLLPHTPSPHLPQDFPTLSLAESSAYSSTSSLYAEDDDSSAASSCYFNDNLQPLYECPDEAASQGFAGLSDIFAPQQESTIRSSKGTVRGVKNRVRAGIAAFNSDQRFLKIFAEREKGKVIVYVTTLGIVRETFERCLRIRKILWTLMVEFEERDVFMSRDTQIQLVDRLHARNVSVPHIFLEGQYLGGVEFLEKLNENGELRRLLQSYMRPAGANQCELCTGFRMLPCTVCNGSKKSVHRNNFTLEFVALKCSSCDESGLVPCHQCSSLTT